MLLERAFTVHTTRSSPQKSANDRTAVVSAFGDTDAAPFARSTVCPIRIVLRVRDIINQILKVIQSIDVSVRTTLLSMG